MLWLHAIVARGFLRRRFRILLTYIMVLVTVSLVFSVGHALIHEVDHDLSRTAEQLAFDIVIPDAETDAEIEELASVISRRPDVLTSNVLDREAVWMMFQSEIGVQSEGMAEVAALPRIIRMHLRAEYVTGQHVLSVVRGLQRGYAGDIETVLVPKASVLDVEKQRSDLQMLMRGILGFALAVFLAISFVVGRSIRRPVRAQLATMHGSTSTFLLRGPFGVLLMASLLSLGLSLSGSMLVTPWLSQTFNWVRGDVVQQLMTQTALASIGVAMLVHVVMAYWPLSSSRS